MLIALCAFDETERLARCLQSLKLIEMPTRHRLAVLVVTVGDQSGLKGLIDEIEFPFETHLASAGKTDQASARNLCLDKAEDLDAALLFFVDPAIEVEPDCARAYEAATVFLPHAAAMAGPTRPQNTGAKDSRPFLQSRSAWLEKTGRLQKSFGQRPRLRTTHHFLLKHEVFAARDGLGLRFDPGYGNTVAQNAAFFMSLEKDHNKYLCWVPEARATIERSGSEASLHSFVEDNYRYQAIWYHLLRHRAQQSGRKSNVVYAVRQAWGITLGHVFFSGYYLIGALANAVFDHSASQRMLGTAWCHLHTATAFREVFRSGSAEHQTSPKTDS